MNFTKPNEPDHVDSPEDWLNSALLFTRALSLMLKENEGIVIDVEGECTFEEDKVIVFYKNKQVHINSIADEYKDTLKEGDMIWMHDEPKENEGK